MPGTLVVMDLAALVLRDGSQVRATGSVIAFGGQVWFDPPLPVPLVAYPPGHEPAPRPSGLGVLTTGVDLDRLRFRREKEEAVEGLATLNGVWRADCLHVVEQTDEPLDPEPRRPFWSTPPCPPPAGGWPEVPEWSNIEPTPPELIPGRVSVVVFRPTPNQVVLVVATSQPDAAEALLRPVYGESLCIVAATWTPDQLEEVRQALHQHWEQWGVNEVSDLVGDDAQVTVTAKVVRVLPEMAEWHASTPVGICAVSPWLSPTSAEPSAT